MGTQSNGAQDVRRVTPIKCVYASEYGRFDVTSLTARIGQGSPQTTTYICFVRSTTGGSNRTSQQVCPYFTTHVLSFKPMFAPSTATTTLEIQRPVLDGFGSPGGPGIDL